MASSVLYAPTVDTYMPAFLAAGNGTGEASCKIYFSLSKFNTINDVQSVHISVVKQPSGLNVVEMSSGKSFSEGSVNRFRNTGIIVNAKAYPVDDEENLFYVNLYGCELKNNTYIDGDPSYEGGTGFTPGWVYKIQIRLCSAADYSPNSKGLATWLSENASNFSEWSTVVMTKAIDQVKISIPILGYNSTVHNSINEDKDLYLSTLDIAGKYTCADTSETLYSYQMLLLDDEKNILEDTGVEYPNKYSASINEFSHTFKTELKDGDKYYFALNYVTKNKYEQMILVPFSVIVDKMAAIDGELITTDRFEQRYDAHKEDNNIMRDYTSLAQEEEDGYIVLKTYTDSTNLYNGIICIRRADSRDNFATWTDIKFIRVKNQNLNDLAPIYDFAIESGVWYLYGIQTYSDLGRGVLKTIPKPIIRNFEHMYLLGENNQQLKLQFNPKISSYKYNVFDTKTDTIGGRYPYITRNGASKYRTFPIEGLISFNMDENNYFINPTDIYGNEDISKLYKDFNKNHNISLYDYTYEHLFREKVLSFLLDGKAKLFKSPTEGNIIVRLMDVNTTPNQQLSRMISTFTTTAHEIADNTMENYLKYKFYDNSIDDSEDEITEERIGQYRGWVNLEQNILDLICKKYNFENESLNLQEKVKSISSVKIEITPPADVTTNNIYEPGYTLIYNDSGINLYAPDLYYSFDDLIDIKANSKLQLARGSSSTFTNEKVYVQVDFVYTVAMSSYTAKPIKSRLVKRNIGQLYDTFNANTSLYNLIYNKYFTDWNYYYKRLYNIFGISIEADAGTVFRIKDESDKDFDEYTIGDTGVLNLTDINDITDIIYVGQYEGDKLNTNKANEILLDYCYSTISGEYQTE